MASVVKDYILGWFSEVRRMNKRQVQQLVSHLLYVGLESIILIGFSTLYFLLFCCHRCCFCDSFFSKDSISG